MESICFDGASLVPVDSIDFGLQLPDMSISRVGSSMEWRLSVPTFGAANQAHPVADSSNVLINEWYAPGSIRIADDFVELYNTADYPANIGNHFLSDKPFAIPTLSPIRPLSFIAAKGYRDFVADSSSRSNHVAFRLSPGLEQIGLFAPDLERIDVVFSPPQTSEISMGRVPDAASSFGFLTIPTPGATNGSVNTLDFGFDWGSEWKYEASGTDLGTEWRDADFDDAGWLSGEGPLGLENESLAVPIRTEFEIGEPAYYFRREFSLPEEIDVNQVTATISTQIDDGFVVYLNGQEVIRRGMPNGTVGFNTLANRNVNEAQVEGSFSIPANLLSSDSNVFAVEVHQTDLNSSDLVFGLRFDASVPITEGSELPLLDKALRITEVMFNSAGTEPLDFIELSNISDEPVSLAGVRLSDAVNFEFPGIVLQPQQVVVVAQDADAFTTRYGGNANLLGEFSGNLSNNRETLALQFPHPFDAAILRFTYRDDWYPETDGQGRSLEIVDPELRFDRWSESVAWQPSSVVGGTPGGFGSLEGLTGDFNNDQLVNVVDVDLLCDGVRSRSGNFDLDRNGSIDLADLEHLVETILRSGIGDTNLDGRFNSTDLVTIFQTGQLPRAVRRILSISFRFPTVSTSTVLS